MTGNTKLLAEAVSAGVKEANGDITIKDAFDADPEELHNYDGILIGTYTWEGEIPDEFMDFYEELDHLNLTGKYFAVFGSADSYYSNTYGAALDLFAEKLSELGGDALLPNYVIDLYPKESEIEKCKEFGRTFIQALKL